MIGAFTHVHLYRYLYSCSPLFLVSYVSVLRVYDSLCFVSQAAMVGKGERRGRRVWRGIREEGRGHVCWCVDQIYYICRCRVFTNVTLECPAV